MTLDMIRRKQQARDIANRILAGEAEYGDERRLAEIFIDLDNKVLDRMVDGPMWDTNYDALKG